MKKNVFCALCIAVFMSVCACVKNDKQAQSPPAQQSGAQAESSGKPASQIPMAEQALGRPAVSADARDPAPAKTPSLPVKPGSGLQILLTLGRDASTLPEDFKIGPLSGAKDLSGDEAAAGSAAGAFLAGLTKGKVLSELLSSASTSALNSIKHHLAEGSVPSSFRLGGPKKLPNGEIAFNVRLFKGDGSAEGELYLVQDDRRWVVSDFQLSLPQLDEKREKAGEKFFPNSYQWLLGE
jgi:hypothetical protein